MSWEKNTLGDTMDLTPRVNAVDARAIQADAKITNTLISKVNGITELDNINRQTTVVGEGVSVLTSAANAPMDVEIEGRTLVSLANSNLESGKNYLLADKKTKVIVDGATKQGISKFVKGTTTLTTADFVGKVAGSTVANPHITRYSAINGFLTPGQGAEFTTENYARFETINSLVQAVSYNGGGAIVQAQALFSFNVVEQIERQLGLIPRATLADKVQWVKDNVNRLTANWHGFGSSVGGNKATLSIWRTGTSVWFTHSNNSHTSSSMTKLTTNTSASDMSDRLDLNGFVHYLAYAEPSDGVIASSISTDYINLEIELKSTAQLNTRAKIIRIENLEGKVNGSVVENPHTVKRNYYNTNGVFKTLMSPVSASYEVTNAEYGQIPKLDSASLSGYSTTVSGEISQQLFSFNIIEAVERSIGKIPATDVSGKVAWLKLNLANLYMSWYGFGTSPSGNKATLAMYNGFTTGNWVATQTTTMNTPTRLVFSSRSAPGWIGNGTGTAGIDSLGFANYLAYAEPSDGVTASTINTDYIELEIELKQDANFSAPKVPLYEITTDEYGKVGVSYTDADVLKRYPVVEGIQHITNPYVMVEGENLIPHINDDSLWNTGISSASNTWKDGKLNVYNGISSTHGNGFIIEVVPNQPYSFSFSKEVSENGIDARMQIGYGVMTSEILNYSNPATSFSFTPTKTPVYFKFIRLGVTDLNMPVKYWDISLTLGSTAKPFTPRNPSYLYSNVKLGAIGDKKDILFKQDGAWKIRKSVESIDLDASKQTIYVENNLVGLKKFRVVLQNVVTDAIRLGVKYDGTALRSIQSATISDQIEIWSPNAFISVSNTDSGFFDGFTVSTDNSRRYFNGWKYTNGTTWTSVTGNGQTATAQQALDTKPTDYTPYKLSYILATPVIEDVTDKVEGSLKVNGQTQVEVGSGIVVREKVVPVSNGADIAYINRIESFYTASKLKNRASKIITIYRNGEIDNKWTFESATSANGTQHARIKLTDFDTTADYTVTYQVLDKHKFTNPVTSTKLTRANNIRTSLEDAVSQVQDTTTTNSIHTRLIVDALARLKARGY